MRFLVSKKNKHGASASSSFSPSYVVAGFSEPALDLIDP
jgi:hypothetical protein